MTLGLVAALDTVRAQIDEFEGEVVERLGTHADAAIFTALPRSGRVRAAALLAEIGDCRARFPDAESLTSLAGAAPSTRRSGKHKKVVFRFACDKKLRAAVLDFAGDSRHDNPWAAHLYQQARARGHGHAHAVRILARAWLRVIWRCWQDHTPYDPARRQLPATHRPTGLTWAALGDGDDDQDHEEPGPVASSTSDATGRDAGEGAACQRSAPSFPILRVSRRSFSTNSRPALRAASGRPPARRRHDGHRGTGLTLQPRGSQSRHERPVGAHLGHAPTDSSGQPRSTADPSACRFHLRGRR